MSRSGYTEDCDDVLAYGRWAGMVRSAMRGKRGQKLLRELRDALDEMPVKRLIKDELELNGEYCALGVLGAKKGIPVQDIDPSESATLSEEFDIAECMAQDIVYTNDEYFASATPEKRWVKMREWVDGLIRRTPEEFKVEQAAKKEIEARGWRRNQYGNYPHDNTNVEISDDGLNVLGTANYIYGRKVTDPDNERYFSHGPSFATDGRNGEQKDIKMEVKYWRYPQAI